MSSTLHLRRPDGDPITPDDADLMKPRTLLIIEIDAGLPMPGGAAGRCDGIGRVIGWASPAMRHAAYPLLTAACRALHQASQQPPEAAEHTGPDAWTLTEHTKLHTGTREANCIWCDISQVAVPGRQA